MADAPGYRAVSFAMFFIAGAPADYLLPSYAGSRKNGDPGYFSFELTKDKDMLAQITSAITYGHTR